MAGTRVFSSPNVYTALRSTQPQIQWILAFLPGQKRGHGVMLAADVDLSPELKMCRAVHLLPPSAFMSWTGTAFLPIYIYIYIYKGKAIPL